MRGFLHQRAQLQQEHWRAFLLPCLSTNQRWSLLQEMSFQLFLPAGFFYARNEGSAWGGVRPLPVSLLLASRDTALDGQQELHLSPGLLCLLW